MQKKKKKTLTFICQIFYIKQTTKVSASCFHSLPKIQNATKNFINPHTNIVELTFYQDLWVTCLNISIPVTPTSWPTVWPGGRNPFTLALGKYFRPDSTDHAPLGGTGWLWIPAAESERLRCEKQIQTGRGQKGKIVGWFVGLFAPGNGGIYHLKR